jgi:hypothetical protein
MLDMFTVEIGDYVACWAHNNKIPETRLCLGINDNDKKTRRIRTITWLYVYEKSCEIGEQVYYFGQSNIGFLTKIAARS